MLEMYHTCICFYYWFYYFCMFLIVSDFIPRTNANTAWYYTYHKVKKLFHCSVWIIADNELEADLAELGAKSVMKVLSDFENYSKNAKQQTNDGATKAPKINSDMGKISWKNITAHVN